MRISDWSSDVCSSDLGHDDFHGCAHSIARRTQRRACGRPADHVGFLTYVINGLPAQMERSAGSLGAIPYVIETPDCSTAGVNPTIRIEYRPQLVLLEIADGANRLRAYQAIDRNRRRRATPGGRHTVQHLLDGPDVAVALGFSVANRTGERASHGKFSFNSPHKTAAPSAATRRRDTSRLPGQTRR